MVKRLGYEICLLLMFINKAKHAVALSPFTQLNNEF
jgi:hypothetical protein